MLAWPLVVIPRDLTVLHRPAGGDVRLEAEVVFFKTTYWKKKKEKIFNTAKKLWVIKGTDSVPKCFNSHFYSSHDSILYPYSSTVLTVSTGTVFYHMISI